MTFSQEERIWQLQCWLHAMKPCARCGVIQAVDVFGGWGCQPCYECEEFARRHPRLRADW